VHFCLVVRREARAAKQGLDGTKGIFWLRACRFEWSEYFDGPKIPVPITNQRLA